MTTQKQVRELASFMREYGIPIYVHTWSPGDGITRYRFTDLPDQTYYGPGHNLGTVLGARNAETWLYAFQNGWLARGRHGQGSI